MLFLIALLGSALALPEVSNGKDPFLRERAVCYEDDTLQSFRYWRVDSEPYCSRLLDVKDLTSTLRPATLRTTTTTVSTTVTILPTTTTVALLTAYTTITTAIGHIQKRENAAIITSTSDVQLQPYAYNYVQSMISGADRNASIASSVYSACSCLSITPKTVSTQPTIQATRTITGSAEETRAAVTVTSGTSIFTITQTVLAQANLYPDQVYGDSSSLVSSSSVIASMPSVLPVPSATTPSLSASPLNSSFSGDIGSGPRGGGLSTSASYATTNITPLSASPSSSSLLSFSSTSSSSRPIATSINGVGCPSINGTIFTTQNGEQFQLQCYRSYGGSVAIGLDEPYFRDCIEECSTVNQGFSAVRCYGTTWLKYSAGIHCNLKSQTGLI
ncbi:MAG: hypothetical protein L6R40_002859 [Gallowayella cf. fulva]|nr:MAG: hypothetical protein L6R40_002859 [Xanthomendoza cf. fulva]